ncbi:unnamed protein product [Clavelina lepadiformis]|uniref:Uncharacterized protein n=1 Tax=Clavelina lepadiformis TaxID=159417 RepID=A0ABP0F297_CLALP
MSHSTNAGHIDVASLPLEVRAKLAELDIEISEGKRYNAEGIREEKIKTFGAFCRRKPREAFRRFAALIATRHGIWIISLRKNQQKDLSFTTSELDIGQLFPVLPS